MIDSVGGLLKQFSNYIKQIPFFLPNISKKKGICKYFGEDMDYLTDIISSALSEYSFMLLGGLRSSSFKNWSYDVMVCVCPATAGRERQTFLMPSTMVGQDVENRIFIVGNGAANAAQCSGNAGGPFAVDNLIGGIADAVIGTLKQYLKDAVLDNKVANEREPLMELLMKKAQEMGLVNAENSK